MKVQMKKSKILFIIIISSLIVVQPGCSKWFAKPYADFKMKVKAWILEELQLTNESTDATSFLWDFGDGTTSTLENPSHTYNVPGNYTVQLTAYSDDDENTTTQGIIIECGEGSINVNGDDFDMARLQTSLHNGEYTHLISIYGNTCGYTDSNNDGCGAYGHGPMLRFSINTNSKELLSGTYYNEEFFCTYEDEWFENIDPNDTWYNEGLNSNPVLKITKSGDNYTFNISGEFTHWISDLEPERKNIVFEYSGRLMCNSFMEYK